MSEEDYSWLDEALEGIDKRTSVEQFLDTLIRWQGAPTEIQKLLSEKLPTFFEDESLDMIADDLKKLHSAILDIDDKHAPASDREYAKSVVKIELDPEGNIENSILYNCLEFLNAEISRKEIAHAEQKELTGLREALGAMQGITEKMKQYLGPMLGQGQEHSR